VPLDARQWNRAKVLFDAALALPDRDRAGFLEAECGSDLAIREEVESLLRYDSAAQNFLTVDVDARSAPRQPACNEIVGPWRLVREIGAGGMGAVWLARRSDDEFDRDVAIKFIRPDASRDLVLRRFAREKKLLARLQHPNIARLFDAGVTDDGQPYLVMEHIDGAPIDVYCNERRLSIRQRLELFLGVCAAVQNAHASLIVHRDLKPANILVRQDGSPILLDFGIAKVLETVDVTARADEGRTIGRAMTPDYASPEQLRGDPVTVASDIFSLGVVIYQLLTGRLPHATEGGLYRDFERAVCDVEPTAPSRAIVDSVTRLGLTPQKAQRVIAGDVDMIVLCALRKEPGRRYASVERFADDIQRYLQGAPVRARPTTFAYRATKFVRRHRLAVAGISAAFVALAAFSGALLVQTNRLTHQRNIAVEAEQRALREADTAEQVTQFIQGMIESANPESGAPADLKVRDALDLAADRVDVELANRPLVAAAVHHALGRSYRSLGRYDEAEAQLQASLALYRGNAGETSQEVAFCMKSLATLAYDRGDFNATRDWLLRALELRRHLDDGVAGGKTSAILTTLGLVEHELGRAADAERYCAEALRIDRSLYGDKDGIVATDLGNLATLYDDMGRYDAAEKAYREALDIDRAVEGSAHPAVATGLSNLGTLLVKMGRHDEAEPLLREALEIDRKNLGAEHPDLAISLSNLAAVYRAQGKVDDAIAMLNESLVIDRAVFGDAHPAVSYDLNAIGGLLADQGKFAEAEPLFRECLKILRDNYGESHRLSAACASNLASALVQLNQLVEAETLLDSAERAQRSLAGEHPQLARLLVTKAELRHRQGRDGEVEPLLQEALELRNNTLGAEHPETIGLAERLAAFHEGTDVASD